MRTLLFPIILVALVAATGRIHADTITLDNGSVLYGKVVESGKGLVIIQFDESNLLKLPANRVAAVERNERNDLHPESARPAPSARSDYVTVTLKSGQGFYGANPFEGELVSRPGDPQLVLRLAEGGTIRIPADAVESVKKISSPAAPRPAIEEPKEIRTTHVVYLKNQRKIAGSLIPSEPSEPVTLSLGRLGVLTVDRSLVAEVKAEEGIYVRPEIPAVSKPAPPATPEQQRESLRRELRWEILREVLHDIVDEEIQQQIGELLDDATARELGLQLPRRLPQELVNEIQWYVRELGRNRTQNRVRAENALIRIGPAVLPYIAVSADHPFDLTRRAVQRIVAGIGDRRGVPLAIAGLTDPDVWVRRISYDTLQTLLPAQRIGYHPEAAERRRLAARERYAEVWREHLRSSLEEILTASAAGKALLPQPGGA